MKKLSTIICYMLIVMLLLVGCKKSTYKISIQTDRNSYNPVSSAVQGIGMSPELNTNDKSTGIVYYWTTTAGSFIGSNDKGLVIGDSVKWSALSDKSASAPTTATVTLEAKEKGAGKILAKTNLTIDGKNSVYTVKK